MQRAPVGCPCEVSDYVLVGEVTGKSLRESDLSFYETKPLSACPSMGGLIGAPVAHLPNMG
jgi:hypothetical protein